MSTVGRPEKQKDLSLSADLGTRIQRKVMMRSQIKSFELDGKYSTPYTSVATSETPERQIHSKTCE